MRAFVFGLLLILTISAAVLSAGDRNSSPYPPPIAAVLDSAGANRGELEKVLKHYIDAKDTLKSRAAVYLIGNMEGHSYVTYVLKDTTGRVIAFDPLSYANYDALTASFDTLEKKYGTLDYKKKDVSDDCRTITADFLISQIDDAFRAWRERPWAKYLTFRQFCDYVLPYRGSNEPLEDWRSFFWEKYRDLPHQMTDSSDPVEAAKLINKDLITWFGFDPRYYYHPTDQGLAEMRAAGKGRCEDMTNLAIYAMRANGLAVTSDYTPFWADAGNNHAWNAILTRDGQVVPFMGAEANPGEYHLANKLAKVYRKMFGKQPQNLAFQEHKQDKLPGWLAGKSYTDVTADYVDVCRVMVNLTAPVPDSVDIAYLCVFNSGEWQPIHWSKITGATATFSDMGRSIMYLPALYLNEKVVPCGPPFILRNDCGMTPLVARADSVIAAHLVSTTRRQLDASTDGVAMAFLTPGQEYELSYWSEGWQSAGKMIADDNGSITFERIPVDGLYWLVAKDSDREERIFTIADGRQVWW